MADQERQQLRFGLPTDLQEIEELLAAPDEALGEHFFAWWIGAQAQKLGFDPLNVPAALVQRIIDLTPTKKTKDDDLHNIPVERALHSAAAGDYGSAGRTFRAIIRGGALAIVKEKLAKSGLERRQQTKAFSAKGANARRKYTSADKARWKAIDQARGLSSKHGKKGAAERIAQIEKLPESAVETIRRHL